LIRRNFPKMANTKQAAKRAKKSLNQRAANVSLRTTLRTAIKKVQKSIAAGDQGRRTRRCAPRPRPSTASRARDHPQEQGRAAQEPPRRPGEGLTPVRSTPAVPQDGGFAAVLAS
jgi:hypothetical protein